MVDASVVISCPKKCVYVVYVVVGREGSLKSLEIFEGTMAKVRARPSPCSRQLQQHRSTSLVLHCYDVVVFLHNLSIQKLLVDTCTPFITSVFI
jgi:hypothetical protein